MSALLAVVQAVVATPVATPTPQVINHTVEVVKTVPAVSVEVMKAAQVGLLFLSGIGASILHQLISRGRWSKSVNIGVSFAYGILIAAVASFVEGTLQLSWSSALDFVTNLLVVLGSTQGRYQFNQWVNSLGGDNTPASTPDASVGLASPVQDVAAEANIPVKASI